MATLRGNNIPLMVGPVCLSIFPMWEMWEETSLTLFGSIPRELLDEAIEASRICLRNQQNSHRKANLTLEKPFWVTHLWTTQAIHFLATFL